MRYAFILGHNPKLSVAEIKAVLTDLKSVLETDSFLIIENNEIDCGQILRRLGGTVKVGIIIADRIDKDIIIKSLLQEDRGNKINFGVSYYKSKVKSQKSKVDLRFGLEIKRLLRKRGVSSRLVTSREPVLSSVVITKNKCQEYMILDDLWLAKTCAVQEFEEYSRRDFGRPVRDVLSGTMPPKLAKIMINLAQVPLEAKILDPFCGSGTVLQEAILLGYKNVIGCDISEKAIKDAQNNLHWLITNYQLLITNYKIFQCNVERIGDSIQQVTIDAIVTEPYLGPALRGGESEKQLQQIIDELSKLYLAAFGEFGKVLKPGGKVVIIFPRFVYKKEILKIKILNKIEELGFGRVLCGETLPGRDIEELVYSRPGQRVEREVAIFIKT